MITAVPEPGTHIGQTPRTLWGHTPRQLHERFWATRGVQVVERGGAQQIDPEAEYYLLTDIDCLGIFRMQELIETFTWLRPQVLFVRLHNIRGEGYCERVITDDQNRFVRFERNYGGRSARLGRLGLTPDPELARQWQNAERAGVGWRDLRREVPPNARTTLSLSGHVFDASLPEELMEFVRELASVWLRPSDSIPVARKIKDKAWGDHDASESGAVTRTRFVGPVWVGSGRRLDAIHSVVGPAVLWDAPEARPEVERVDFRGIVPSESIVTPVRRRRLTPSQRLTKRGFDIVFSLLVLTATAPLFPIIMLAIWFEDGRPWFFGHLRESRGGREFRCWKFRTMYNNAEEIKQKLLAENANQADGPQFFIEDDPRITRVGNLLRKTNLDELPQFLNVLRGDMTVVGPRPSPYKENQYCPAWREARLSVRPGVTGLWQVSRSREAGKDFQEWIQYDIDYVENIGWRRDFHIIWRTFLQCLGR